MADQLTLPLPGNPRGTAIQPGATNQAKPRVRMNPDGSYTVFGGGNSDWYGPNDPIAVTAPPEQRFRQWDYPVGFNLDYTRKRGPGDVPYEQLYNFARTYDLARILIERRKNQIAKLEWDIQPRDQKAKPDKRCEAVQQFLRMPDGQNFWQQWVKMLLDDMLVYDAAFVFPLRDVRGRPLALEIPDGTTFKFLVDQRGKTPMPPWEAYQQILHGVPAFKFTKDELFYLPFNPTPSRVAGYSIIEQVVVTITMALSNQASQLSYFTHGSGPDMILSVPAEWTPEQTREWKEWWDALLEGQLQNRRGTMFVPGGMNPINTKDAVVKTPLDEWIARVMCFAFGISPMPFVSQMNRATAQSAAESAKEDGTGPAMDWVRACMDFLIERCFGIDDLCFRWREEDETDPKTKADTNDVKLRNGTKTINECRAEDGLDPTPDGDVLMIYTATGPVLLKDIINPPEPVTPPAGIGDSTDTPPQGLPAGGSNADETQKVAGGAASDPFDKRKARALQPSKAAVAALTKQVHAVLKRLGASVAHQIATRLGKAANSDVDTWLSDLDFAELSALTAILDSGITQAGEDGFTDAVVEVGGNVDGMVTIGLPNTRAVQYAQERAAALIGNDPAGGELAEATRMMLRSAIANALDSSVTVAELEADLADDYAFSASRAETIARTELKNAMSAGNIEGWRASGAVTHKVWQLSSDHPCCDICDANADAGEIPINETFPSGDDMPGAHPNCECVVFPVVHEATSEDQSK